MSGHARTCLRTHDGWSKHLLSKFDVDVFMHLWDTVGPRNKDMRNTDNHPGIAESPLIDANEIVRLWNPLQIMIEPYLKRHDTFAQMAAPWYQRRDELQLRQIDRPLSNFSMYYKWWSCNFLKCQEEWRWNKQYDLVIRTRPDMLLKGPMPLDVVNTENVYIPKSGGWHEDEISDFMTVGTSQQVNVFCEIYNQLNQKYDEALAENDFSKAIFPHKLFYWHFKKNNLPFKEIEIPCEILDENADIPT